MNNNPQLSLQPLSGVSFGLTSVIVSTEDQHKLLGTYLLNLERCESWWIADYLLMAMQHKWPTVEFDSMGESTREHFRQVARFFKPEKRRASLSFSHHVEVMAAGEEFFEAAVKWLDVAENEKLSVVKLRERIRKAENPQDAPPPPPESVDLSGFAKLSRWASHTAIRDLAPEAKESIKLKTLPLLRFLQEIHSTTAIDV